MALSTKIFVGSLPNGVKPQELRRLFEDYGIVTECDVMNRCGFVHMETVEMAENAIKALNGTPFKGQAINVEPGRPKETKKGKPTRGIDRRRNRGGSGASSSRRRRRNNRGNPDNRRNQALFQPNDNNNPNINSEEALQLCSALFLEVSKMLKPEVNMINGTYENEINSENGRGIVKENNELVRNSQLPNVAKNAHVGKRGGRRHNRGNRIDQRQNINASSDNDSNRNNNIGVIRENGHKQLKHVASTPYNKESSRSNNFNQIPNRGQDGGGKNFGGQGHFKNRILDQAKSSEIWQVGNNFSSERPSFGDGYNNESNTPVLSGIGGMNSHIGNHANNNMSRERFRGMSGIGNNFNDSFLMGNQDRRGFALPERQSFDYNGQQMRTQQQTNIRGGNQTTGRGFLNSGLSSQNSLSFNNNHPDDMIFTRRHENFGAQSTMTNLSRMSNQQQNFGYDDHVGGSNRGSSANYSNLNNDGVGLLSNLRNNFESTYSDNRNLGSNSRNFQNDFPPLSFSGSELFNRSQPRQNMMSSRRYN